MPRAGRRSVLRPLQRLLGTRTDVEDRLRFMEESRGYVPALVANSDLGLYCVDTTDRGKGRAIFLRGQHSSEVLVTALAALAELGTDPRSGGRWFVDAGAYTGSSTIPAVRRHGFERALAIEPEPGNFRLLRANIALNELEGTVRAVRCAASDARGSASLRVEPRQHGKHALVADGRRATPTGATIEVPVGSLDEILDTEGIEPRDVGLLKIDVQGVEAKVLRGAVAVIDVGAPAVVEYAVDELAAQNGGLDELERVVAERFSRFLDLRAGDESGPPRFRPAAELPALRERYHDARTAKALGQKRGVTDLLLVQ